MFFVSFGLMLVHVVFTAIWLVFFARVFLIGHVDSSAGEGAQPLAFCSWLWTWHDQSANRMINSFDNTNRLLGLGRQFLSDCRLFDLHLHVDLSCTEQRSEVRGLTLGTWRIQKGSTAHIYVAF